MDFLRKNVFFVTLFFTVGFGIVVNFLPHVFAQYPAGYYCIESGGWCAINCGSGSAPGGTNDCTEPQNCCVALPTAVPTNTPVPTATPRPTQNYSICDGEIQGEKCYQSDQCACTAPASNSCEGVTLYTCGVCYCTDETPVGNCTGWGACTLQYNGWYCRIQECDYGCTCDALNPTCCAYQIDCACSPVEPTGEPGATAAPTSTTAPPSNTPSSSGNLTAIAKIITTADTSCTAIVNSANYLNNTVFTTFPNLTPINKTQTADTAVNWPAIGAGTDYYVQPFNASADYVWTASCYNSTNNPALQVGTSATLQPLDTLNFYIGYAPPGAFSQIQGGDMYGSSTIFSRLPSALSPRLFVTDPTTGNPGVLMYGSSYDFDPAGTGVGADLISTKNWQINQTLPTRSWYAIMSQRVTDATKTVYDNGTLVGTKPPVVGGETTSIYTFTGDLTTNGTWGIADNESYIIQITGNLTINGPIQLTGANKNGFIAFLVSGNITVNPTVGTAWNSTTPMVEGVYVADGTFSTGDSSNPGTERFVGKGMFIADGFTLERDLESVGHNVDTSAELFVYNPMMYFTFPKVLKDLPYTWQEVSP